MVVTKLRLAQLAVADCPLPGRWPGLFLLHPLSGRRAGWIPQGKLQSRELLDLIEREAPIKTKSFFSSDDSGETACLSTSCFGPVLGMMVLIVIVTY